MSRVIILEGPDGAGKSHLADRLRSEFGFEYIHSDKPRPGENLFYTYTCTLWKAILSRRPVVIDRLYLGELVYGPIMRGDSLLTMMQVNLLNRVKRANGVREVLCLPPFDVCRSHWASGRPEYVPDYTKFRLIYEGYEALEHLTDFRYDWTTEDTGIVLPKFFNPLPMLPLDMLGSPKAELLIVGEQVNLRKTKTDWAFYATDASSGFLNSALSQIDERRLAFCNALSPTGIPRDFTSDLKWLPNFKVAVALGRKSEAILAKQGVNHVQLPHPAYVKRFMHGSLKTYAAQFQKVLENSDGGSGQKLRHGLARAAKTGNGVRQRQVAARVEDKGTDQRTARRK